MFWSFFRFQNRYRRINLMNVYFRLVLPSLLSWLSFPSVMRWRPLSSSFWVPSSTFFGFVHRWFCSSLLPILLFKNESCISHHLNSLLVIKLVVVYKLRNVCSDILNKGKSFKNRNVLDQFLITFIIIPIWNWHSTLRLKQIRNWGVVQNYDVP